LTGGYGKTQLGLSEAALGKTGIESGRLQEKPIIGGISQAFIRDQIGGQLQKSRKHLISPTGERILKESGVQYRPEVAGPEINNLPLMRGEMSHYQDLTNKYIDEALNRVAALPSWKTLSPANKEKLIKQFVSDARDRARAETLQMIPSGQFQSRIRESALAQ
jgi:hypothetical protein